MSYYHDDEDSSAPINVEAKEVTVATKGDIVVEKKTKLEPKKSHTKKSTKSKKKSKAKASLADVPYPGKGGHSAGQLVEMQDHERLALLGPVEKKKFEAKYM